MLSNIPVPAFVFVCVDVMKCEINFSLMTEVRINHDSSAVLAREKSWKGRSHGSLCSSVQVCKKMKVIKNALYQVEAFALTVQLIINAKW